MEASPEAVGVPSEERTSGWAREHRLVRAVQRIPRPLGTKLLVAFTLIVVLLALVAVVGLIALGQSNSRGRRLQKLQATDAYVQQVKADSRRLLRFVETCSGVGLESGCRPAQGASRQVYAVLDEQVITSTGELMDEIRAPGLTPSPLPVSVVTRTLAELKALQRAYAFVSARDSAGKSSKRPVFGSGGFDPRSPGHLQKAQELAAKVFGQLNAVATGTSGRAQRLVAADRSSFTASRNLLLGVAGGSLLLALALGLLLSWSVVVPLRRTEARLAAIGAGDLTGRLEVANRDEIGRLARRVNDTSDELQRVYRELELASEQKSQFVTNMSHELRTPLNAIIGFSEVLHEQMFGELNERQLAYVNDVLEAGRHLLSLINDVLDLAKIEAGKMELELSQVALPELLRSALSMHSERASRGGLELTVSTEPDEITIAADERRVRQIVFNLLSNAIKFTPAGGKVDVAARLDDGEVDIAVADTGPGISAEDLDTIFEEFEQAGDGRQAEEGTGLGLPLSRKLVELHGGRIWVDSEAGRGSTFHFTLPVRQDGSP
jgi:signal transduction histidine kinase